MVILMSAVRAVLDQANNLPRHDRTVLESFQVYAAEFVENYPHAMKQSLN